MQLVRIASGLELNMLILNPEAEKTIFMIHGMFGNLAQFYLTFAPLVAQKNRVVLFDLKSQGRSQKSECGYDFDTLAKEVVELADAIGCDKFSVLGYSFGCWVALRLGRNYPERIEKIITLELPDWPKHPVMGRGTYTPGHFMDFVHYLNTDVRENFFKSTRQMRGTYLMYDFIFNYTTFSEDMNNERAPQRSDFENTQAPILFAFGRHSVCFNELMRVAPWAKTAEIYVEDGSHDFFLSKLDIVAQRINDFLAGTEGPVNPYYQPANKLKQLSA